MNLSQSLRKILGESQVSEAKQIATATTMQTPCTASLYAEVLSREELVAVVELLFESKSRFVLLGGGSNVVFGSDRYDGVVVKNRYQEFRLLQESETSAQIRVSSGFIVNRLVAECEVRGLSGFEYHRGLPGTVGGAIAMNSKWTKPLTYFGDHLTRATLIGEDGQVRAVERDYFNFSYDYSKLKDTKEILIDTEFELTREKPEVLKKRSEEALAYRKQTQPFGVATSGCYFQNISEEDTKDHNLPSRSAGYLIDHAGFKNKSVGGYTVSPVHANFIINTGGGTPQDLQKLIYQIREKVESLYGVKLHEEVQCIM